jgi:hypothetical protein
LRLLLLLLLCRRSGNEGSVDKLLKQIGGFMSDIAGARVKAWACYSVLSTLYPCMACVRAQSDLVVVWHSGQHLIGVPGVACMQCGSMV